MKLETNFIMNLIKERNPINTIGEELINLWLKSVEKTNDLGDYYYRGEEETKNFEEVILKSFWEFYDLLVKDNLKEKSVFELYQNASFLLMDGMSLREGALLYKMLEEKGYNIKYTFNFSAIPSDTEIFKEKIKIPSSKFSQINNHNNVRLSGKEKYIWSYFPDVMLNKIQVGHTVISSLQEMYKIVEKIILEALAKLDTNKIIVTSDHGYIRTEAGFIFPLPEKAKKKFQKIFGSKRYIKINDLDISDLIDSGYVIEFNGYYIVKSRYLWPVPGRFSIYIHGGVSLMECFTPVLIIEKG